MESEPLTPEREVLFMPPEAPKHGRRHPEQRQGEIYMGNTRFSDMYWTVWKTGRLGLKPLRPDGAPYTGGGLRPWFIQSAEVQEKLDALRRSDSPWKEQIRALEEMLDEAYDCFKGDGTANAWLN